MGARAGLVRDVAYAAFALMVSLTMVVRLNGYGPERLGVGFVHLQAACRITGLVTAAGIVALIALGRVRGRRTVLTRHMAQLMLVYPAWAYVQHLLVMGVFVNLVRDGLGMPTAVIAAGLEGGLTIGTPAEKAGAVPLAWATDPFSTALTGAFVKVLARYRQDDDPGILADQWAKLETLQAWCRGTGKPLVLEVLVARKHEAEQEFEASGRPAMLAAFIAEAYRRRLTPEFWKIEGTLAPEGARTIDTAIAAHPSCRQIILGKAAELSTIDRWFAACAASTTASGFAIGRSVFWEPSAAYLTGTNTADQAAAAIASTYLALADKWDASRS
jgi:5-dehydro-2-deoxygluconokinase